MLFHIYWYVQYPGSYLIRLPSLRLNLWYSTSLGSSFCSFCTGTEGRIMCRDYSIERREKGENSEYCPCSLVSAQFMVIYKFAARAAQIITRLYFRIHLCNCMILAMSLGLCKRRTYGLYTMRVQSSHRRSTTEWQSL